MAKKFKEENFIEELKRDLSRLDKDIPTGNSKKLKIKKDLIKKVKGNSKKSPKEKEKIKIIEPKKVSTKKKFVRKGQKPVTFDLKTDEDIAMDFATKVYQNFNKLVKSILLFGSATKKSATSGSDIDIMILIDDASIKWDAELIAWYREELEKIVRNNPYKKNLHVNTIKLTTWWDDLLRGDPIVINIIRDGVPLIDFGGFFEPLKYLLFTGRIKATPEAIYSLLQRAPQHISRSKISELNSIEGLFWSMVDSAHAALIAAKVSPPSPEHLPITLKEAFVDAGKLNIKYVIWYRDLLLLHKKIAHGEKKDLKGVEIDDWQDRAEEFLSVMTKIVDDLIS